MEAWLTGPIEGIDPYLLPAARRGAWAETSAQIAPQLAAALKPGDTVLVKGSNGSKMAVIIDALKARGA